MLILADPTTKRRPDSDHEDDSSPDSAAECDNEVPIVSNITKKASGDENGEDADIIEENKDSSSEDSDDEDGNTEQNTDSKSPSKSQHINNNDDDNDDNDNNVNNVPQQNNNNDNANANPNSNGSKYGIIFVIISILWVIIRDSFKNNTPLPICNQIPDSSMKFKLQCPKCDAFDADGKCIIYAPLSSQQFTINAKGTSN